MANAQARELLALDVEPAEERVKSWLSKSYPSPASVETVFEYNGELINTSLDLHVVQEENHNVLQSSGTYSNGTNNRDVSKSRTLRSRNVKRGLGKYFVVTDEAQDSTLTSDDSHSSSCHYRPYCNAERKSILQYLVEKELYPFVKGNFIWQQMEMEKVCARTWQSMKTQFQKYIYPHLEEFALEKSVRNRFVEAMERGLIRKNKGYLEPGQRGWRRNCKFYSFMEDALILYYILERHRYQFTHGNTMWKRMQVKNVVPGRSWHSLKSRYNKFLAKYIEKFASKNKRTVNFIGSIERAKLLNKFQLDYLVHMAVFKGSTSKSSKEAIKQLKSLGMEFSALPVPGSTANNNELEDIKNCAYVMVQQLSEKVEQLMQSSHENIAQNGETIQSVPSKNSSNDVRKLKMKAVSFADNVNNINYGNSIENAPTVSRTQIIKNSDIFEKVHHNVSIYKPPRCENKNIHLNLKTVMNENSVIAHEGSSFSTRINQPGCNIYERNMSSTDETQTDESDHKSNTDALCTLSESPHNVNNDDILLCNQSTMNGTAALNCMTDVNEKNRGHNKRTKAVTEKRNLHVNLQANLGSSLKHDDQHTDLTHVKVNESNISTCVKEDSGTSVLVSNVPGNINSEENVELNVQMQFDEQVYQTKQEICAAGNETSTQVNMTNDYNDEPVEQNNQSMSTTQLSFMTDIPFDISFDPDISLDISSDCSSDILASVKDVVECVEENSKNNTDETKCSVSQQLSEKSAFAGCSKRRNSAQAPTDLVASESEDDVQYSLRLSTDDSGSESSS